MKQATCRNKFSGKSWQRRIDKVVSGKIHIRQVYQWVREGRIDADQFEEIMQAIVCPDQNAPKQ